MTIADVRRIVEAAPRIAPPPKSPDNWLQVVRQWAPPRDLTPSTSPVPMAVEGLIQVGKVGALVAAGGTGKTTLQLTLGISHATRRPFLGQAVKHGTFMLLSSDDSQDDLDEALRRVAKAQDLSPAELDMVREKVRVISLQGLAGTKTFSAAFDGAVHSTDLEDLLVEAAAGIPDLVGLGLDTFRQFAGGSANDEQVAKCAINGATGFASRVGAYVLISHHTGKTNYRDGITDMYAGSGSAAIADNARFILLLQPTTWSDIESKVQRTGNERGDPMVLQPTRGSLLVKPTGPIFLHRDGYRLGRIAGAALSAAQILDERDRAVLRAVRAGAQSKNAIAARAGGKKAAVLDLVDDLEARGKLRNSSPTGSVARPIYVLTEAGAKLLEMEP